MAEALLLTTLSGALVFMVLLPWPAEVYSNSSYIIEGLLVVVMVVVLVAVLGSSKTTSRRALYDRDSWRSLMDIFKMTITEWSLWFSVVVVGVVMAGVVAWMVAVAEDGLWALFVGLILIRIVEHLVMMITFLCTIVVAKLWPRCILFVIKWRLHLALVMLCGFEVSVTTVLRILCLEVRFQEDWEHLSVSTWIWATFLGSVMALVTMTLLLVGWNSIVMTQWSRERRLSVLATHAVAWIISLLILVFLAILIFLYMVLSYLMSDIPPRKESWWPRIALASVLIRSTLGSVLYYVTRGLAGMPLFAIVTREIGITPLLAIDIAHENEVVTLFKRFPSLLG